MRTTTLWLLRATASGECKWLFAPLPVTNFRGVSKMMSKTGASQIILEFETKKNGHQSYHVLIQLFKSRLCFCVFAGMC